MENMDTNQQPAPSGFAKVKKLIKYSLMGVVGLFILLFIIALASPSKPENQTATPAPSTKTETSAAPAAESKPVEIPKVTAKQLYTDYEANEVAADSKYKGKFFDISGTVKEIGKDILDKPYVTFEAGTQYSILSVQAMFDKSQQERLAQLTKGQQLTVRCEVGGKTLNISAEDCIFISE